MLRVLDLNLWWNTKVYNLHISVGTGLILLNLIDASLRPDEYQQTLGDILPWICFRGLGLHILC